jgi:hypothetical protein
MLVSCIGALPPVGEPRSRADQRICPLTRGATSPRNGERETTMNNPRPGPLPARSSLTGAAALPSCTGDAVPNRPDPDDAPGYADAGRSTEGDWT